MGTIHGFWASSQADCDLRGRGFLALRDLAEQLDQRLIGFASLGGEARERGAEVGAVELGGGVDLAGEEALAQRAPGNEADAEFFEHRQHFRFGISDHREYSLCTAVTGWTA